MFTGQQLGAAIEKAIKLKGVSKKQVADDFGVKPPSIQDWIKRGTIGKDKIEQLFEYFSDVATPEDFGMNRPDIIYKNNRGEIIEFELKAHSADLNKKAIPVVGSIPAGGAKEIVDSFAMGGGFEYLIPDVDVGENAFALIIEGDSMIPRFSTGDKVIIDPAVNPRPGDFVAFRLIAAKQDPAGTFKQYRPRGLNDKGKDYYELVPLNENYPTIRSDQYHCQIVGVMVEHRIYRGYR